MNRVVHKKRRRHLWTASNTRQAGLPAVSGLLPQPARGAAGGCRPQRGAGGHPGQRAAAAGAQAQDHQQQELRLVRHEETGGAATAQGHHYACGAMEAVPLLQATITSLILQAIESFQWDVEKIAQFMKVPTPTTN